MRRPLPMAIRAAWATGCRPVGAADPQRRRLSATMVWMRFAQWWMIFAIAGIVACQSAATAQQSVSEHDPPTTPSDDSHDAMGTIESVDSWLSRIEARATTVVTLHADLLYDRIQRLVGDRQRRFGKLVFHAGPPGRFCVQFDRLLVDRRLDRDVRRYIFDGQWLVERYDSEKLLIKRQVTRPPTPGQTRQDVDPLALGSGPFVVPVSLKKDRLLKRFNVTLLQWKRDDPADTVHFGLVPKVAQAGGLIRIDLWYDRRTLLPVRVRTLDQSENESVVTLSKTMVNQPVNDHAIDTSLPTEDGWRIEIKPLEDQPAHP